MVDPSIILVMLLGNIVGTIVPYLRKLSEGKVTSFDYKYIGHLVGASLWQFILTVPLLSVWSNPSGFEDVLSVHILAFFFGLGGYKAQLEATKYISYFKSKKQAS